MIRQAQKRDIKKLRALWKECFNEDGKFFFDRYFLPQNCLVFSKSRSRKPCAMLHIIPYEIKIDGELFPVFYLYGIGTRRKSRGKGIAGQLVNEAIKRARLCGCALCMLVPQTESLFNYYKKFGFRESVYRAEISMKPSGMRPADYEDIGRINAIYENALTKRPHLRRSFDEWKNILDEGYTVHIGNKNYAVYHNGRLIESFGGAVRVNSFMPYAMYLRLTDKISLDNGYFNLLHD